MKAPQLHGFGHAVMVLPASDYRRDRMRWLTARRAGLGASDTAAILGLNDYSTALDVYLEKTSTSEPVDSTSDAATAGQMLETPVARRTVREHPELGKLVTSPGLLAHPDHPWMLATVDFGLAPRGQQDAPVTALLEVKTTQERHYRNKWIDGRPPDGILIQAQQQLAVTGYQTCWVTCMRRDTGRMDPPFRVDRSETVIEQIIHYAGTWWADHIEAGVQPDPVFRDYDSLAGLFPADESLDPLPVTPELETALADLAHARARAKNAAADEAHAKFLIKLALENRTAISAPDGTVLATWKPQTVRRLNTERLAADHPGLLDQYKEPKIQPGTLRLTKEDS
jgi:putative phage-type endonuclease